jgi:hypothetical protein
MSDLKPDDVIPLDSNMAGRFFKEQPDGSFWPCLPCFVALILRVEGDSIFVRELTKIGDDQPPPNPASHS